MHEALFLGNVPGDGQVSHDSSQKNIELQEMREYSRTMFHLIVLLHVDVVNIYRYLSLRQPESHRTKPSRKDGASRRPPFFFLTKSTAKLVRFHRILDGNMLKHVGFEGSANQKTTFAPVDSGGLCNAGVLRFQVITGARSRVL